MAARKGPCTGSRDPGPVPAPGPRLPQGRDARLPGPRQPWRPDSLLSGTVTDHRPQARSWGPL